jgi:hypothetical protein
MHREETWSGFFDGVALNNLKCKKAISLDLNWKQPAKNISMNSQRCV